MRKKAANNIEKILKHNLCNGCGTCIPLCPMNALTLCEDLNKGLFLPKLDKIKCTQCSVCLDVCPISNVTDPVTNPTGTKLRYNQYIGNYIQSYAGYTLDEKLALFCFIWRSSDCTG